MDIASSAQMHRHYYIEVDVVLPPLRALAEDFHNPMVSLDEWTAEGARMRALMRLASSGTATDDVYRDLLQAELAALSATFDAWRHGFPDYQACVCGRYHPCGVPGSRQPGCRDEGAAFGPYRTPRQPLTSQEG